MRELLKNIWGGVVLTVIIIVVFWGGIELHTHLQINWVSQTNYDGTPSNYGP
jgi:hypothetical protein